MYEPPVQNTIGLALGAPVRTRALLRQIGFRVGDVAMFDISNTGSTYALNNIPGGLSSGFSQIVLMTTDGAKGRGILCVCEEAGLAGGRILVTIRGRVTLRTSGSVSVGDNLVAAANLRELSTTAGAGDRYIARAVQNVGTNLWECDFDGCYGFGTKT
jgi:hypothetical protein